MRVNILKSKSGERALWQASLACFILAALTGALYRLGMLGYVPSGLGLDNIRHAHSHLMFFGWAVPFPLVILFQKIKGRNRQPVSGINWMRNAIWASLCFGLMAYPFFLLYGYRPVPIGSGTLPLSVIFSGLVMISWYGFMVGYLKGRSSLGKDAALPWFDGALIMLLICSFGAWGVAVVQALAPSNYLLMKGLTHFFLATFTEGWVVLIILAILLDQLKPNEKSWKLSANFSLGCIALGAPLTFPYGISESLLTPILLAVARLGGMLTAVGVAGVLYSLWIDGGWKRASAIWLWPLALVGIKAGMQFFASIIPSSFWLSDHALRVLYLHILLLGAFTLVMAAWLQICYKTPIKYYYMILGSIMGVLISLVFLTSFWPSFWRGNWIFYLIFIMAVLPPLAFGWQWIKISNLSKST